MWTALVHRTGAGGAEDPLEEGQQPHKDHLAATLTEHASNVDNKDISPETAP